MISRALGPEFGGAIGNTDLFCNHMHSPYVCEAVVEINVVSF